MGWTFFENYHQTWIWKSERTFLTQIYFAVYRSHNCPLMLLLKKIHYYNRYLITLEHFQVLLCCSLTEMYFKVYWQRLLINFQCQTESFLGQDWEHKAALHDNERQEAPLTLPHLRGVFYILIGMNIISSLVFMAEVMANYFNRKSLDFDIKKYHSR